MVRLDRCVREGARERRGLRWSLIPFLLVLVTGPALGQGQVDFTNRRTGLDAPVYNVDGTNRLAGATYLAQLHAGASPDPALMTAVGSAVVFGTGSSAGYFNGGTVTIPFIPPGSAAYLQVRAWPAACGQSFEAARAASCVVGASRVLLVTLPLIGAPPTPLVGLKPFALENAQGPTILRQPRSQVVPADTIAILNVLAFGSPPLTYQWKFNGAAIAGANSATLTLPGFSASQEGDYAVLVGNSFGTVLSAVATLALPPGNVQLTRQPASVAVNVGESVAFRVGAAGVGPLQYQWRRNGIHLTGETNPTLRIDKVMVRDGGLYTVEVSNPFGAVRSQQAALQIRVEPAQTADAFSKRVELAPTGLRHGSNAGATREPGEPDHAGQPGGASVWFTWRAPQSGVVRFDTTGSLFDTLLAVYQGGKVTALTEVASDDDRGGSHTSLVQFNARAGDPYEIVVDGLLGMSGDFLLSWGYEENKTILPLILEHPRSQTVAEGGMLRLRVLAQGTRLSYQWFLNGAALGEETRSSLVVSNMLAKNVGTYEVEVSQGGAGLRSRPARVEIGPEPAVQSHDKLVDLRAGGGGLAGGRAQALVEFAGGAGGGPVLPPVVPVSLGSINSQILNNTGDGSSEDEPIHCGVISASSAWFALQPTDGGLLVIDTIGSEYDTVLAVYTGPDAEDPNFWLLATLIACDDNSAPDGVRSQLCFSTKADVHYYVMVGGAGSTAGVTRLNWRLVKAPTLLGNGQRQLVTAGKDLALRPEQLSVPAGTKLQWMHEGAALPGETNRTIYLCNVHLGQGGEYRLVQTSSTELDTLVVTLVVARVRALPQAPPRLLLEATEPLRLLRSIDMTGWLPAANVPARLTFQYDEPDLTRRPQRYYEVLLP